MATFIIFWMRPRLVTEQDHKWGHLILCDGTLCLVSPVAGARGPELRSGQTGVKCHMGRGRGNQGPGGEMSLQFVTSQYHVFGCFRKQSLHSLPSWDQFYLDRYLYIYLWRWQFVNVLPLDVCLWSATWPAPLSDVRCSVSVPDVSNLCLAGQRTANGK